MMDVKGQHIIKRMLLVALIVVAVLGAYFFSISLVAFQKTVTISPVEVLPAMRFASNLITEKKSLPDLRPLLGPIPYQSNKPVFDILPIDRFRRTIQKGDGNCSNLVFGMAYKLGQDDIQFQIVHIMPYKGFLRGSGHTVLNMRYKLDGVPHEGIVDLLEGGVPRIGDDFLDLLTLRQRYLSHPYITPLNDRKDNASVYYGDFLDNAAVGVVPDEEVKRYFDFINRLYIPLGSKRLERIVFSGIAIVAGFYPHTYVIQEDYSKLYAGKVHLIWAGKILVWAVRLIPILILLLVFTYCASLRHLLVARKDEMLGVVEKAPG